MRGIGDKEDGGSLGEGREEVTQDQRLELNCSVRYSGANVHCGLQTPVTNTAGRSQCESLWFLHFTLKKSINIVSSSG